MTDRVYPSAKTNGTTTNGGAAVTATTKPPTAAKPNLYNPTRPHPYRPQPNHSRRRHRSQRSCVCLCCFWSFLLVAVLILLAAIAGCAVYVLYSPRRPAFSVAALRISRFNLSTNAADDTTRLTAALNLTISAKNPNKKIIYTYDPISITALSNQVLIANGSFPFFTSAPQNTTIIRSSLSIASELVDADLVKGLRSDLKRKNGLDLKILMDTKVVVKMEKLKSKKLGIRVTCDGIHGTVPKGKSPSIASITDAKCKVDLRIKIWKWTF
ncbi:Late embryogenesis abundant protein, LEA-14 protein [Actinidia chinensis var. chinensis]|uniref:Late embryogenesis abundant protein, LEA-14 protein n=1 Tax=Actinidia chinensis var. chinensis TaxID=1590841 RepID=A0A2R6PHG4_ACTCC|nr:Late embryogenesis abundant protein, LEA-14 protein [Actinidia chinensis var. chinensis]